jgi:hypothetical protein
LGLARAERVLPGFFQEGLRLHDHFRGRLLAAGKMIVEQRLRLGLALADFSLVSSSMFDSSTISFSVSRSPDGLMMSARYEDNPGPPIL